jgi:hypothetical protein
VRRRPPPAPPAGEMPLELARFRVEDWCDPTDQPPEWWDDSAAEYWWVHARLAHMRARRAWKAEHAG